MARAYILINTKSNREYEVVKELKTVTGVKSADVLFGYYDIVAIVETETLNDIGRVIEEIRSKTDGIEKTSTMIVKDDYFSAISY